MSARRCRFCHQSVAPGTGHRPVRAVHPTPAREWDFCEITGVAIERANERCPMCGSPVAESSETQMALIRHGGYGRDQRVVRTSCLSCPYRTGVRFETTNPRHRANL